MDIFLAGTEQLSPDLVPTKRMWKIFTKRLLLVFSGEILGIPCCCKFVALFPDACTRLSSILQRMMTFANPPNSPRFKPYHSKQKADNEVWNWIKFQFLHFPFSFVNRTQCCAMIAMQARSSLARSILWCKCIDILKKIHCMMQTQIKHKTNSLKVYQASEKRQHWLLGKLQKSVNIFSLWKSFVWTPSGLQTVQVWRMKTSLLFFSFTQNSQRN